MNAFLLIFLLGSYIGLSHKIGQLVLCSAFMLVFGCVLGIAFACPFLIGLAVMAGSLTCFQVGYAAAAFVVAPAKPSLQNDVA